MPDDDVPQVADEASEPNEPEDKPERAAEPEPVPESEPEPEAAEPESEPEPVAEEQSQPTEPVAQPAEEPAELVTPQPHFAPPQQQPQPQPQPAYANYPPPGAYAAPPGQYPPGAYPPGAYPGGYPVVPRRPAVLSVADLLPAVRDGLSALGAAYATAIVALFLAIGIGLGYEHLHASFGDYLATAAWLTATSLGVPIAGTVTASLDSGGDTSSDSLSLFSSGSDFGMTIGTEVRVVAWLLTITVLFLVFRAARRRERALPSTSLGQLVARAALPAAVVSITLLILALATHRSDPFGAMSSLNATADDLGSSGATFDMGIDAPLVFVGPLLLVFAAALIGRIGVWMQTATGDPRAMRLRTQVGRWTPAFRVAWLQTWVIGTLVGIGLWVYAAYEVFFHGDFSHGGSAGLIGALFLLPNLAIYGTFFGFGVTLYATAGGVAAFAGGLSSGSDGGDGSDPDGGSYDIGLFTSHRPWGLWLLLLAVLLGTAAPAILARRGVLFKVNRDDYVPNGVWRSVVLGMAGALAITLLGELEMTMSMGGSIGGFNVTESFGPSLIAAVCLTALWYLISYMTLSLSLGHRVRADTFTRAGAGAATVPGQYGPYGGPYGGQFPQQAPPPGTPGYEQFQQYQQFQQQYPAGYQQPYGMQQGAVLPTSPTVPVTGAGAGAGAEAETDVVFLDRGETIGTAEGEAEANAESGPVSAAEPTVPNPTIPLGEPGPTVVTAALGAESPTTPFASPTTPFPQQQPQPQQPQYAQYPQPGYPQPGLPGQPGYPPQYAPWPGQPGGTQPVPMRRGMQRKVVIPLVVVLVLVVGGLIGYHYIAGNSLPGAEAAVTSYFQELESGNASAAASLAIGPYQEKTILGAATLAKAANRPTGMTIVSSKAANANEAREIKAGGVTGNNPTFVVVHYTVHGTKLTDTYLATQNAKTSKWQLVNPYQELSVGGGWSSTVTVDGVSFDEEDSVEVFPGAHVVADPSSPDFSDVSTTVYPTNDSDDDSSSGDENGDFAYEVASLPDVSLPDATLSAKGQAAAQAAYKEALDQCASDAESGYGVCGIDDSYDYYETNNVTWKITTVGTVDVDLSDQDSDGSFYFTADGSVASESGDYTDWDGTDQKFSDETTDLEESSGSIVFNADGTATVTLEE